MSEQKYLVTETQLTNIATAIRLQRDSTAMIEVDDMPMEIGLIDKDAFKITVCDTFEGDVIADKYLESGVERAYTGWSISPYFNIFGAKVITFSYATGMPQFRYCEFYDSSKVYISSLETNRIRTSSLVTVPTGAKYVRTSGGSSGYTDGKGWIPYMLQRDIVVPYETYVYEFNINEDIGTTKASIGDIGVTDPCYIRLRDLATNNTEHSIIIDFNITNTVSEEAHIVKARGLALSVMNPTSQGNFTLISSYRYVTKSDGVKYVASLSGQLELEKPTLGLPITIRARSDQNGICVKGHYTVTITIFAKD